MTAADEPSADAPASAGRHFPRSAGVAALAVVAGVLLVLLTAGPTWVRVTLRSNAGAFGGVGGVKLTGHNVAAAAVPLALVAAAGLIAIALVRTLPRRILAVLVAAAAAGILVAAVRVLANPTGIARSSGKVKVAGDVAKAHLAAAPFLSLLGGLLILGGAVLTGIFCSRWPGPTSRYERVNARAGRPSDTWDALERGEDPTSG